MSNVLLVGVGPFPGPTARKGFATGLRMLAYLSGLLEAGHSVSVLEIAFPGSEPVPSPTPQRPFEHEAVSFGVNPVRDRINAMTARRAFDCVIAMTDVGGRAAAESTFTGPLWVDYGGHPMAERQVQDFQHRNDDSLADAWSMILPALLRGDKFAGSAQAQRHAIIGELGSVGRLNALTCGYEFVEYVGVPMGIAFEELPPPSGFLASRGIPRDARVIFSTGVFNNWMDEETLFHALRKVMRADYDVHFAVTGGAIEGMMSVVFDRFHDRVRRSDFANRVHFLGWVEHREFLQVCVEGHVGVNVDLPSLEAELGGRNRVMGWVWAGARCVTTALDERTNDLARAGLLRTVPLSHPDDLAAALKSELDRGRQTDDEAARTRAWLLENCAPAKVSAVAARWASKPRVAPDREALGVVDNPLARWQRDNISRKPQAPDAVLLDKVDAARELVLRLQGSRSYSLLLGGRPEFQELMKRILK